MLHVHENSLRVRMMPVHWLCIRELVVLIIMASTIFMRLSSLIFAFSVRCSRVSVELCMLYYICCFITPLFRCMHLSEAFPKRVFRLTPGNTGLPRVGVFWSLTATCVTRCYPVAIETRLLCYPH